MVFDIAFANIWRRLGGENRQSIVTPPPGSGVNGTTQSVPPYHGDSLSIFRRWRSKRSGRRRRGAAENNARGIGISEGDNAPASRKLLRSLWRKSSLSMTCGGTKCSA